MAKSGRVVVSPFSRAKVLVCYRISMLSLYTVTVYCVDQTTTQSQTGNFWKLVEIGSRAVL